MDNEKWTQAEAIALCKQIEVFAPSYGFHVALTGGCLYKEGERSDLDLVFYRDRRVTRRTEGLLSAIISIGDTRAIGWSDREFGWRFVCYINGKKVDMLFPQWNDEYDKDK